jgi:hypothetical protein
MLALLFSNQIAGQKAYVNRISGWATQRLRQKGNAGKGNGPGNSVRGQGGERVWQVVKDMLKERCQGGFTNPAKGQGGQSNAQLGARNVVVESGEGSEGQAGFAVPRLSKGLQACRAGANQCKLSRHKEGVQPNKGQNRPNLQHDFHGASASIRGTI